MMILSHASAKLSHYDKDAKYYDAFNEKHSQVINTAIENILKKYRVKSVLDLMCGTGSQVFWLAKRGYTVVGSDINASMLDIAKHKARKEKLNVKLLKGDVRTLKAGKFDAAITIFNAIGHLTAGDFEKAIHNISYNLKEKGLYLFDIFNLSYLIKDNYITHLTIDWQKNANNKKIREIQYSTIDKKGILASYTTAYVQEGNRKPTIAKSVQTLQVYTAEQLREVLYRNGFKVLKQCGIDGSAFKKNKTDRILTVARKI